MVLFRLGLAEEELPGLAVVVREGFGPNADLIAFLVRRKAREAIRRVLPLRLGLSELGE